MSIIFMKLLTKSESQKLYKRQETEKIVKGARISQLIDKQVNKLNRLEEEYEYQTKIINEAYKELFDKNLKEILDLQKIKNGLLQEIKQLQVKKSNL